MTAANRNVNVGKPIEEENGQHSLLILELWRGRGGRYSKGWLLIPQKGPLGNKSHWPVVTESHVLFIPSIFLWILSQIKESSNKKVDPLQRLILYMKNKTRGQIATLANNCNSKHYTLGRKIWHDNNWISRSDVQNKGF